MNEFFIGLQFLTRISIVKQTVWTEESFGKSVKFFPAVGAVLGICYAVPIFIFIYLTDCAFPIFTGALGFFLNVVLTGGLHCDGLMDSADGLFSGREKDKMLEIMKDSLAGAFGVVSLVTVSALQISTLAELAKFLPMLLCLAVYAAPIIGRLAMVLVISIFPYARPEGIGKAFSKYATPKTFFIALIETFFLLLPILFLEVEIFMAALMSMCAAVLFALYFGKFVMLKIGGLTGDIYGAVEFLAEVLVLIIFLFAGFYFN
ncbi:MAG: adenosylcobinamide-GDP ribazoletransferase [Selenomonadaceae bacterium]|nr:adenosylcobinamide-GDP ribazoletransferase [Selenomonadaceae bacterium]